MAFETLLDRLPDLRLADDAEPANRPANFVSGYESMPVTFTPVRTRSGSLSHDHLDHRPDRAS